MVVSQQHPEAGEVKVLGLPVKFSATPGGPRNPASTYGENTRAILGELGYSAAEIDGFVEKGITATER